MKIYGVDYDFETNKITYKNNTTSLGFRVSVQDELKSMHNVMQNTGIKFFNNILARIRQEPGFRLDRKSMFVMKPFKSGWNDIYVQRTKGTNQYKFKYFFSYTMNKYLTVEDVTNFFLTVFKLYNDFEVVDVIYEDTYTGCWEITVSYDWTADPICTDEIKRTADRFIAEIDEREALIEEDFIISDEEWKKTLEYVDKGSDMSRVAKACKDNTTKLLSRYLILLEIGYKDEAEYFAELLESAGFDYKYLQGVKAKFVKEIPAKWQKVINQYKSGTGKIATAGNGGTNADTSWVMNPLKNLSKLGINYTAFYMDLSNDKKGICKKYGIEPSKLPSGAYWHDRENGRCYTMGFVVLMYNGVTDNGDNHFYFCSHTCESGDSCYGYDVSKDPYFGSNEDSSKEIQRWICEHVSKVEEKAIDYSWNEPTPVVSKPSKPDMVFWFDRPGVGTYCRYQNWMASGTYFDNETDAEIYIANNCSGYSGKPSDIVKLILKAPGSVSFGGPKNKSEMSTGGELKRAGLKDWAALPINEMGITDILEQLDFALEGKRIGVMGRKNTTYFFFNEKGEFFAEDQYGKMKVKKEADAWEFVKRIQKSLLKA